ncbi:MAG: SRPBCC family protein [Saprospiraceae bacterium]|nr:SRPBCC family protein [Saprospiraceae bacterium]
MRVYGKQWQQDIQGNPQKIWDFFSRPENLQRITPKEMNFCIQSDITGQEMYEGMMIVYTVSPLLGINMTWATEITHIRPGVHFIDEQRIGPYAMWHHEHWFEPIEGGVRMKDLLHYAIPFGPLGAIANALIVDKKVEGIFQHRTKVIEQLIRAGEFE